jgi:transposase InsO family protein
MDFLIVPTVSFKLLFVLVILRHHRRRLLSYAVTTNPKAEWIAHQIADAFPWNDAPDYLIRDREGWVLWSGRHRALAAKGIRDHPIAPRSPWQNGHAERLIGSIAGMPRLHCHLRQRLLVPRPCCLHRLLQRTPNTFVLGQRLAKSSAHSAARRWYAGALQDSVSCTVNLFFIKMFP